MLPDTIEQLEKQGLLDPNCKTCQTYFYPEIQKGKRLFEVFAPRHQANHRCESGRHNHCSCDKCF